MNANRVFSIARTFGMSGFVCSAFAADIDLTTGPASVAAAPKMSFVTQTTSNSTTNVVGAFSFLLQYDPAIVRILAVTPATGSPFLNNLFADSSSFASGQTRVTGFQTSQSQPVNGEQIVCAVRWQPIGGNGTTTTLSAAVETLVDSQWKPAAVTSVPTNLTVSSTDTDGDGIADVWESTHGLNPVSPQDALMDSDGDGNSNLAEFRADTDPKNASSNFQMAASEKEANEFIIRFTTVLGRAYRVEVCSNLGSEAWTVLEDNIQGTGNLVETRDPNTSGFSRRFYRAVTQ
ncbi:MAG: hypothetical protein H7A55_22035 [Verrucomicrobiaceae bacterium]|nr:hypothetical protein [Verrucomicrobiaceae bacterium]